MPKTHTNQTNKERMVKAARENQQVTYKGNPIRLTADLSAETLQARREWQNMFKVLKGKYLQPILLHLARLSFKIYGEIKSFPNKLKRIQQKDEMAEGEGKKEMTTHSSTLA